MGAGGESMGVSQWSVVSGDRVESVGVCVCVCVGGGGG